MNNTCDEKNDTREKSERPSSRKSGLGLFLLMVIINGLITAGAIWGYHHEFAPRIMALDLREIRDELRVAVISGKISKEEMKGQLDSLDRKIREQPAGTVILLKEVVIGEIDEIKP